MTQRRTREQGFTLAELMVTVAVAGVLAAYGMGVFSSDITPQEALRTSVANHAGFMNNLIARARIIDAEVSMADEIAAGLPPDARGTLVASSEYVNCNSPSIHPAAAELCETVRGCQPNSCSYTFIVMTYKVLRVGGTLEEHSRAYFRSVYNSSGTPGDSYNRNVISRTKSADISAARPIENHEWNQFTSTYCYANGTCDPVTFYFETHKVTDVGGVAVFDGTRHCSRIAVTPTGSVVPIEMPPIVDADPSQGMACIQGVALP